MAAGKIEDLYTRDGAFGGFVTHPRSKVWIAAVEGYAVGGGFEIALSCDLIVASDSASFTLPEVKRSLIAAAGGAYRLVRALPRAIALELLVTGAGLSAARAETLGLVNRVATPGQAVDEALALAQTICANAPVAVRETLGIARRALDADDADLFALGREAQDRVMATADFAEGVRAFIDKRPPVWTGR